MPQRTTDRRRCQHDTGTRGYSCVSGPLDHPENVSQAARRAISMCSATTGGARNSTSPRKLARSGNEPIHQRANMASSIHRARSGVMPTGDRSPCVAAARNADHDFVVEPSVLPRSTGSLDRHRRGMGHNRTAVSQFIGSLDGAFKMATINRSSQSAIGNSSAAIWLGAVGRPTERRQASMSHPSGSFVSINCSLVARSETTGPDRGTPIAKAASRWLRPGGVATTEEASTPTAA